jgi:predicted SprT family Zn-dependent metalloprotease
MADHHSDKVLVGTVGTFAKEHGYDDRLMAGLALIQSSPQWGPNSGSPDNIAKKALEVVNAPMYLNKRLRSSLGRAGKKAGQIFIELAPHMFHDSEVGDHWREGTFFHEVAHALAYYDTGLSHDHDEIWRWLFNCFGFNPERQARYAHNGEAYSTFKQRANAEMVAAELDLDL